MRSNNIHYLPAIDHLRGFAALLVVYYHGVLLITYDQIHDGKPFNPAHWLQAGSPFAALIVEGHTAVALFMVLSGFIFTVGAYGSQMNYLGFIRNRLLRTYPLFMVLLIVGISAFPANFSVSSFLQTVFFFGNAGHFITNTAHGIHAGAFSSMFWAIAVEWQFYLIFPLLLAFVQRSGVKVLLGIMAVFLVMRTFAYLQGANIQYLSYWTIAGRIDQFLLGMMAGVFYRKYFRSSSSFDLLFIVSAVLIFAVLLVFNRAGGWPANNYSKIGWPTLEGLLWASFIIGYLSIARWIPWSLSRPMVGLGIISYSIYLIHFIVINLCIKHRWDIEIDGAAPIWSALLTTTAVVLPIVIPVSMLTYFSIEKPFLSLRGIYKRPTPTPTPTADTNTIAAPGPRGWISPSSSENA